MRLHNAGDYVSDPEFYAYNSQTPSRQQRNPTSHSPFAPSSFASPGANFNQVEEQLQSPVSTDESPTGDEVVQSAHLDGFHASPPRPNALFKKLLRPAAVHGAEGSVSIEEEPDVPVPDASAPADQTPQDKQLAYITAMFEEVNKRNEANTQLLLERHQASQDHHIAEQAATAAELKDLRTQLRQTQLDSNSGAPGVESWVAVAILEKDLAETHWWWSPRESRWETQYETRLRSRIYTHMCQKVPKEIFRTLVDDDVRGLYINVMTVGMQESADFSEV